MDPIIRHSRELAELHFHVGQAVQPHILWSIAHEQGIKLPSKDYWDFIDLVTLNKPNVKWEDYHKLFHLTELIQSSPQAIERSLYEIISGAYRANNITVIEPSLNPMYRNREGEQDLDYIILAALRGMERALAEFPQVRAGLIFILDRRLSYEKNKIIVKKAIKYRDRGVVGIDIAGPDSEQFEYKDYVELFEIAQAGGLKTTIHTGEEGSTAEMDYVISNFNLNRVNHGIKAYKSPELMKKLVEKDLTLCICPTSNLKIGIVKDVAEFKQILQMLWKHQVKMCFNTDSPAMFRTNIRKEIDFIKDNHILTEDQINQTIQWAFEASFVDTSTASNLYL
jgi:adenosine deaminase